MDISHPPSAIRQQLQSWQLWQRLRIHDRSKAALVFITIKSGRCFCRPAHNQKNRMSLITQGINTQRLHMSAGNMHFKKI